MGKLIYSLTVSLDGYVADEHGNIDFATPTEEVHAFVDDVLRNVGTFLLGRKAYEVMAVWDTMPKSTSAAMNDFARTWRAANKVVYSRTLDHVTTADTTIERAFDPAAVKRLVAESSRDTNIGGPHLAAPAIKAGIIDEYHLYVAPVMLGGGTRMFPAGAQGRPELVDCRKFDGGLVHLQYR
jgi:dihydrofolate reductase